MVVKSYVVFCKLSFHTPNNLGQDLICGAHCKRKIWSHYSKLKI